MSDIKPKLILRSGVNATEKSPSPSAKLLLNHGKPNFTINRSKSKNDTQCPFSPSNSETPSDVWKSTVKNPSNGYVKPSSIKIPLNAENEVNKVVLRRTKLPEENGKPLQQNDEPEFIKAQRKIAERLANQNILDFENRKSGYFTHVMMSPTSPTKQMELPVVENHKIAKASVVQVVNENVDTVEEPENIIETDSKEVTLNEEKGIENVESSPVKLNGSVREEKPIEVVEVAKAMINELVEHVIEEIPETAKPTLETVPNEEEVKVQENGVVHNNEISNGNTNGESIPKEENKSSEIDANFEQKPITSFAKDLSSEPNKYPDTVKVVKEANATVQDELIQEMYKMKFDIHADHQDVKVIPTICTNE